MEFQPCQNVNIHSSWAGTSQRLKNVTQTHGAEPSTEAQMTVIFSSQRRLGANDVRHYRDGKNQLKRFLVASWCFWVFHALTWADRPVKPNPKVRTAPDICCWLISGSCYCNIKNSRVSDMKTQLPPCPLVLSVHLRTYFRLLSVFLLLFVFCLVFSSGDVLSLAIL